MPVTHRVRLDLLPLQTLRKRVSADLRGAGGGPISQALLRDWPRRFFGFQQREFRRNSSGGGDWPPLSPATLGARRSQGRRGRRILRVTDAIYGALFPGRPGNVIRRVGVGGIEMGIGGGARHPEAGMSIGRLAEIHHGGAGNVPARPVMRPIDVATAGQMFNDMAAAMQKLVRSLPKLKRR